MTTPLRIGDRVTLKSGLAGSKLATVVHVYTDDFDVNVRHAWVRFDNGRKARFSTSALVRVADAAASHTPRVVYVFDRSWSPACSCGWKGDVGNLVEAEGRANEHAAAYPACPFVVFDTGGVRCALVAGHEGGHATLRFAR